MTSQPPQFHGGGLHVDTGDTLMTTADGASGRASSSALSSTHSFDSFKSAASYTPHMHASPSTTTTTLSHQCSSSPLLTPSAASLIVEDVPSRPTNMRHWPASVAPGKMMPAPP